MEIPTFFVFSDNLGCVRTVFTPGSWEPRVVLGGGIRGNKEFPAGSAPITPGMSHVVPWRVNTEVGSSTESAGPCSCKGAFYYTRHIWGAPRALQHPQRRIYILSQGLFWLVNLFLWGVCVCLPQKRECSFQAGIWIPYAWKIWPWLRKSEVLPLHTFLVTGLSLEQNSEAWWAID